MSKANDPTLKSWVPVPADSDFPIQNLPFGIAQCPGGEPRPAVAIGEHVLDLGVVAEAGLLDDLGVDRLLYQEPALNGLMRAGSKAGMRALRERISDLLNAENGTLRDDADLVASALHPAADVAMALPVDVGDYTDFYSSEQHAFNVGAMFRDPDNALLPNWKRLPVGYHGRASSIIPSGVPIHRPRGQMLPADADEPVFGPCRLLDFELEMAFVTFDGKPLGESISTGEAEDYIFGLVIFNDWSARDIQKWEYVPLGPFLAKNFASSISPWIVTLDALEPFRTDGPVQDPAVLPYLEQDGGSHVDLDLEVFIDTGNGEENRVSLSNFKHMYWSMRQQLAHHTVNGCNLNAGDMMASGTISGNDPSAYGSMLELSWRGTKPLTMADGSERKFINDGDSVIMRAHNSANGVRIGFGEVRSLVLPPA
ncbi:MAG: fumarylacetoacetase [Pseudomonadota bacterium]